MQRELTGRVHEWEMFDRKRTFAEVTLPFHEAREMVMAVRYNANSGKGQQREIVPAHLKKIKAAMESGEYTPAAGAVALTKEHRKAVRVENGSFTLPVDSQNPLNLIDAGHRVEAVQQIIDRLDAQLKEATDEPTKAKLARWKEQALRVPITFTVHLDGGDAQRDFINLQLGRPADAAHLLSIKVQQRLVDDPGYGLAFGVARLLNKQDDSPLKGAIRFDSRGVAPIPISTICSKGGSDVGTSLVGLARVGLLGVSKGEDADPAWLAFAVQSAFRAVQQYDEAHPEDEPILETGKVLTPIANGGTKGSATMLIGVGTCLAYRMAKAGRRVANDEDLELLVAAAKAALDKPVRGNFSGPVKRQLLGEFARAFFADHAGEKHHGIPVELLKLLSCSTFAVPTLPKEPKPRKAPTRKKKGESAPDLEATDGFVPIVETAARHPELQAEPVVEPATPPVDILNEVVAQAPWEALANEPVAVAPWEELQG